MRIDHILLSNELSANCTDCVIDKEPRKNERPSDHTPVMVDFTS
jgi:exodeoxyribonuclease-3